MDIEVDENGKVVRWDAGEVVFTQDDPSKRPVLVDFDDEGD